MATAIALRRLEIEAEAEAKAEAEGGTSNFVSSIWYDVKVILVISMTSVVEYQYWVYKIRTRFKGNFEMEECRGDKNG